MDVNDTALIVHPQGEIQIADQKLTIPDNFTQMSVDTNGGLYHVEWDETASLTPMGQLVFFAQFLKAGELFTQLCEDAPFNYTSNNAPNVKDVLGTLLISVLAGHSRYAHMTALRYDKVVPPIFGMSKVVSEDSGRRAIEKLPENSAKTWLRRHMRACWEPLLTEAWVLDIDSTVKTIYGHQEAAEVGYNPQKPGRPSHTYHTYWIARIRMCLDVEVRSGKEHAGKYGMPGLWELIDSLPREKWPEFLRGDSGYGSQDNMLESEQRGIRYLFKLKQTKNVKGLINRLELSRGWVAAGKGFDGKKDTLQLEGWDKKRSVVVLRRKKKMKEKTEEQPCLLGSETWEITNATYEYMVLVTNLEYEIPEVAQLYRDRADSENPFDELKNQWGWGGFTTQDLGRCQIMARFIGLAYNWWSLFVRLLNPNKHTEAITSRPALMCGAARQTTHAGAKKILIDLNHCNSLEIKRLTNECFSFLNEIIHSAEQLTRLEKWKAILSRVFVKYLKGRTLSEPTQCTLSG